MRLVVTSGSRYLDIDAYAGVVGYAELLRQIGHPSVAVSTSELNYSITPSLRELDGHFVTDYSPEPDDGFVLIDVSDPTAFDAVVDKGRVQEVIDHHPGFEEYWRERIGGKADIEFIGAACTQVYERWVKEGVFEHMSEASAQLLAAGILDNTLNFQAEVSTPRDETAYAALGEKARLSADWPMSYFTDCQAAVTEDVTTSILNDSKILKFKTFADRISVGQLVVWDASEVLAKHTAAMEEVLAGIREHWFMNLVSIGGGQSYFVTNHPEVQEWLMHLLGARFHGDVAETGRLWLRKEILKADIDHMRGDLSND
jgi:inorganic pyrophosphatase/exopolyphosphatase